MERYSRLEDSCDATAVKHTLAGAESNGSGMGCQRPHAKVERVAAGRGDKTCVVVIALHSGAELATGKELALAIRMEQVLVLGVAWRTLHDAAKAYEPDTGSSWRAAINVG
jgi:hypothetical protein